MDKNGEDLLDDIIAEEFGTTHTFKKVIHDGTTLILTTEPSIIQTLLATKFKDFETGTRRRDILYPLVGDSIFSSDGAFWEHSRALFRPQFSRENINDLDATSRHCDELIRAMGTADDKSGWTGMVDLLPLLYNFTIDTATEFLFGESVDSQSAALPEKQSTNGEAATRSNLFLNAFDLASRKVAARFQLQGLYFLADGLKFRRALADLRKVTDHFVQRAISEAAQSPTTTKEKPDVAKPKYSLLTALVKETTDKSEIRNQILALLFASRDTSAALLSWCFIRLALHPDIFSQLRQQILTAFPPDQDEVPDFRQLKSCRPLQYFIQEVLRLHPVPINGRFAVRDTVLPAGGGPEGKKPVALPQGQFVLFSVYHMHRRKDLWGDDAHEFHPERWSDMKVPAWQYLPFSGGPRVCLGQQFALTEVSYVLVRILQHFDAVEPVDEVQMSKLKKGLSLTVSPADGVRVRLHRAG